MSELGIGHEHNPKDYPGFALRGVEVTREVADLLLQAGMIVKNTGLWKEWTSGVGPAGDKWDFSPAPGEEWGDICFAVNEATRTLKEQRESAIRKRLLKAAEEVATR